MEFKGKTAIVTGAGRGIGEGIALAFGREGANVVVADMSLDNAKNVAAEIASKGGSAMAFKANVTKKSELDEMVAEAHKRFGSVDILINNAGIETPPTYAKDLSEEAWDRVIAVNLKGVFLCCQAVIPLMISQRGGKIVNIGSVAASRMTFFGGVNYTASKHGVAGLTHHLAWELAEHHINVNEVRPGATLTPLAEQGSSAEYRDFVAKRLIPLGRWCTLADIADAVLFLSSDRARMITGVALEVDGGATIGWGEDLRTAIQKRIEEMQTATAH